MEFGVGSLDVRIRSPFTSEFDALIGSYGHALPIGQRFYRGMLIEPFGLPAIIHVENQINGDSKVQFIDVPSITMPECVHTLSRLVEEDPLSLSVVRLHLGCDVPGVHVSWFRNSMRVRYRQNSETFGRITNESKQRGIQTLYFGAKHSGVTVYDKVAERLNHHRSLKIKAKKSGTGSQVAAFESMYGFFESSVLTRVERKYANGKIPIELSTVGSLISNALAFNPFENIVFCPDASNEPSLEMLGFRRYQKIVTWLWEVAHYGADEAYKRLSKYTNGNAARHFTEIQSWLNGNSVATITQQELLSLYQDGIKRQLGGTA